MIIAILATLASIVETAARAVFTAIDTLVRMIIAIPETAIRDAPDGAMIPLAVVIVILLSATPFVMIEIHFARKQNGAQK